MLTERTAAYDPQAPTSCKHERPRPWGRELVKRRSSSGSPITTSRSRMDRPRVLENAVGFFRSFPFASRGGPERRGHLRRGTSTTLPGSEIHGLSVTGTPLATAP